VVQSTNRMLNWASWLYTEWNLVRFHCRYGGNISLDWISSTSKLAVIVVLIKTSTFSKKGGRWAHPALCVFASATEVYQSQKFCGQRNDSLLFLTNNKVIQLKWRQVISDIIFLHPFCLL